MKILLIDNYDSFTFNIVHLLREVGVADISVKRNTEINMVDLEAYHAVIASPGPGLPAESGSLMKVVRYCLDNDKPYLGICLGHQALGEAVGARLEQLQAVKHGVQEPCTQSCFSRLLKDVPECSNRQDDP